MSLPFVLYVEREDVIRKIFPLRCTRDQLILVLENVCEAVVKVVDWRCILVKECYIVLSGRRFRAVDSRKFVFGNVCVCVQDASVAVKALVQFEEDHTISPTTQLVAVMHSDN